MSDDDSWLNIDEPETTQPPPKSKARDLALRDPKFGQAVECLKDLTQQQRNFIMCFARSHFDPVLACKDYAKTFGRELSPRRLSKWMQDDSAFLTAIVRFEEVAARAAGVSVANTLDCLADIRRRNLGIDDRACMQALELIGKHLKMFRVAEDMNPQRREGPGLVVVQIQGESTVTINSDTESATIKTVE